MKNNTRLVYSTVSGRIKPPKEVAAPVRLDGIVRIRRETKGRKGKGVTTVSGLPMEADGLKQLAKDLKRQCGTGGCVKKGVIEIQGDHRDAIKMQLEQRGYTVKFAGG